MNPAPATPCRAGPRAAPAAVGLLGLFGLLVVAASGCELFLSQDGNPGHPCLPGNDCRQGECINGICSTAGADCSADADCDDGDACTMNDTCHQGGCVGLPRDADEDGHVDAACPQFGVLADDCNDQSAAVHPGLAEEPAKDNCDDGLDNDCDGRSDAQQPSCSCAGDDGDGDGFFDQDCGGLDCDDDDASAHPTAREDSATDPDTCADGIDNDCDGQTDADDSGCAARICSPDGWCWENPLPQGNDLLDVWIAPGGDVWAVGAAGTVLRAHLDDGFRTWWREPTPTAVPLTAVWGADDSHVWAVGVEGTVLFYDGTGWVRENSGSQKMLSDVFGFGPGDVWVVGQDGTLLRRLGDGVWRPVPLPLDSGGLPPECDGFQAIWSGEPSEIWIAVEPPPGSGVRCNLLRLEPGRAELLDVTGCGDINALWGSGGRDDIFAAAADGTVCRLEQGEWTLDRQPEQGMEHTLHALSGTGPDDVWAVGNTDGKPQRQILVHRGAQGWEPPEDESLPGLHGVCSSGQGGRTVAVGTAGMLRAWDGSDWADLFSAETFADLQACHGDDAVFWAVGQGGVALERDQQTETWFDRRLQAPAPLRAVRVVAVDDVWVAGGMDQALASRWDGGTWQEQGPGTDRPLHGLWAAAGTAVYLVGEDGQRIVFDGGSFENQPSSGPSRWQAVFGWPSELDDARVWVAGTDAANAATGLVSGYLGGEWIAVEQLDGGALNGVWGPAADDFWAVGDRGTIWHFAGQAFQSVAGDGPAEVNLRAIHGIGGNCDQAWIAGSGGTILRHTPGGAAEWTAVETDTSNTLHGIWLAPGCGRVWAVGNKGTVLSREIQ